MEASQDEAHESGTQEPANGGTLSAEECAAALRLLRDGLSFPELSVLPPNHPRFCRHGNQWLTPFAPSDRGRDRGGFGPAERASLVASLSRTDVVADRAMGCLVGMAAGDAAGAPLEFRPAADSGEGPSRFRADTGEYVRPLNCFGLEAGQWTDDAAMGLCLADSILFVRERRIRRACGGGEDADGACAGRADGDASKAEGAEDEEDHLSEEQGRGAPKKLPDESTGADDQVGSKDEEDQVSEERGRCTPKKLSDESTGVDDKVSEVFDGADARIRFWTWWHTGYNNAFRLCPDPLCSVGLGGNISKSIYSMRHGEPVSPRYESQSQDAGNGSLMRLGPVPVAFHDDIGLARDVAEVSSYTTHPGPIAAEACRFLAHLIVRCINRREAEEEENGEEEAVAAAAAAEDQGEDGASERTGRRRSSKSESQTEGEASLAAAFLDGVADEYLEEVLLSRPATPEASLLRRLLASDEPEGSLERNWNWRRAPREGGLDIRGTLERRGGTYNGYPNHGEYFGSYSLDGLAVALHSARSTDSFDAALERCVNFCGDADSTASICGQIAGALYGWRSIGQRFRVNLARWDDGEVALRAALLADRGGEVLSSD